MRKTIKSAISSISVKMLLIIIALVLPLNIIAIIYTNKAVAAIVQQVEYNVQKIADYQMQELEKRMDIAQSFLTYFSTEDADCIRLKNDAITGYDYESAKIWMHSRIKSMAQMTNGGDGYFYYYLNKSEGIIYANADGKGELTALLQVFLDNFIEENYPRGWHVYEWNDQSYLVLLMQEGQMLYGSAIRLDTSLQEVCKKLEYPYLVVTITEGLPVDVPETVVSIHASVDKILLTINLERQVLIQSVSYSSQIFWGIALLYLVLIPVLYAVLRKLLIRPMEQLKIESYEKELSRQKMELRNLQLQIRPHFLLNTFNIIFSLAQRKETVMIQETIIYLSEYFRYIFREEKDLEMFQKELNLIKGYVHTASIRYSGRIEASYDIEPELDFVRVPPLLIHNFVENAVKYGLKQNEILHIWISGSYDDGTVTFTIEDDGKGMTPEVLARNQQMFACKTEPKQKTAHLGLYNSMKRLNYFYGEKAYIEVVSEIGEGTTFMIHFPYNLEVDNEFIDCE